MREVILSNEELDIINRLQNYQFPSASYDPYEVKCEDLCMNIVIILLVTSKQKTALRIKISLYTVGKVKHFCSSS